MLRQINMRNLVHNFLLAPKFTVYLVISFWLQRKDDAI